MLDLTTAAAQIAGLTGQLARWEERLPERRDLALRQLRAVAGMALAVPDERARRWMGFADGEPPDARHAPAALPDAFTVIAVDGSQIEPDFHELAGCFLINVGSALFRCGGEAAPRVEMESLPSVRVASELLDEAAADQREPALLGPDARQTEVQRMLAEVARLRDAIEQSPPHGPMVALVDGPLVAYWVLNLLDEASRQAAATAYVQLFDAAREHGVALAGYISRSRSAEVTHLLRYSLCPEAAGAGQLCAACRDLFPRSHPTRPTCYGGLEGVLDRHLFAEQLAPGERSATFSPGSGGLRQLAPLGHDLRFFFLRAGDDLARVEVPAWVAADSALMATLQAVLLDQAALGQGYPLALCEAHEQAVVRAADRALFYDLVNRSCLRERLYRDLSPKLRTKRQPVG